MNNRRQKSIKYNFIMNAILSISAVLFPLITFPYVSRVLLPEGTGKVAFASSLIYYFSMVAQLGIPMYGVNACARVRDNKRELSKVTYELLGINLIMTAIAYIGLAVILLCVPQFYEERTLYIIVGLGIIFDTISVEWLYKAVEQYDYITIRSLIFKIIFVIATFLLVRSKEDYHIYAAITTFTAAASGIVNFLNARKYHIEFQHIGGYNLRRHMKPVVIFFFIVCASAVYTHMDTVMLGLIKSEIDVGYYNVSLKIRNILVSIVAALGTVLLPRTSYYVEQGMMNEFRAICAKAVRFVCILAIPIGVFFVLFAKESVFFISGPEYGASILPMQLLMPTLLSVGIGNIFGIQMLIPLGREKTILKSEITGAVVNLIANSYLIPRYAAVGAALGTLLAELTVSGIQIAALKQDAARMFSELPYFKITIALLFAAACSLWMKSLELNVFLTLLVAGLTFFGGYFAVLLILKEQLVLETICQFLSMIRRILRKIVFKN